MGEEMSGDEDAKVVWPIPSDGITYQDAAETLFALSDAVLCVDDYDATGNGHVGDLFVSLWSMDWDRGFHRAPLISLLENALDDNFAEAVDDDPEYGVNSPYYRVQLLIAKLILVYEEWKRASAKLKDPC